MCLRYTNGTHDAKYVRDSAKCNQRVKTRDQRRLGRDHCTKNPLEIRQDGGTETRERNGVRHTIHNDNSRNGVRPFASGDINFQKRRPGKRVKKSELLAATGSRDLRIGPEIK